MDGWWRTCPKAWLARNLVSPILTEPLEMQLVLSGPCRPSITQTEQFTHLVKTQHACWYEINKYIFFLVQKKHWRSMGPSISLYKQADKVEEGEKNREKAAWDRDESPRVATSGACATCRDGRWRPGYWSESYRGIMFSFLWADGDNNDYFFSAAASRSTWWEYDGKAG